MAEKKKVKQQKGERCELCGKIETVGTVAIEVRGNIKWICFNCYQKRKDR